MLSPVDIMAFGAHPDDVECGAGGLLAQEAKLGRRVAVVDLTRGELSTNGTPEEREGEAKRAAVTLGLSWRENLKQPDGFIHTSDHSLKAVVNIIRKGRPELVLVPYWEDRHPDHAETSKLVTRACYLAGLQKYDQQLSPFRPRGIIFYFLSRAVQPSFYVDITDVYDIKRKAVMAHVTQFGQGENRATHLNSGPGKFTSLVESRDRYFGAQAGVMYAEGFYINGPLLIKDPLILWGENL